MVCTCNLLAGQAVFGSNSLPGCTERGAPRPSLTLLGGERGAAPLADQCLKPSPTCSFPGMRSLLCRHRFASSDSLGGENVTMHWLLIRSLSVVSPLLCYIVQQSFLVLGEWWGRLTE